VSSSGGCRTIESPKRSSRIFGWPAAVADPRLRSTQHNDLWIAATALRHGLPLVTHNRRDFVDIPDLIVISEVPDAP
jgi:predicted nucleic acid-binding protein